MKTKLISGMLLVIICAALLSVFTLAQVGAGRNIVITLVNQEPDPVEPGSYVTLRFKVENWGSENAQDMTLELIPQHPLTTEGTLSQYVGSVWGRQKGDLGAMAKFRVKIDENAAVGETEISARYKLGNDNWIGVGPYNISIQTSKAVLAIRDVTLSPETVGPGQKANITLYLQNTAKSLIRNVAVKLDLSSSSGFSPVGFNEKIVDSVKPGEIKPLTFTIVALPDAAAGAYRIPLTLTYDDELNKEYSRNGTLGALIGSKAELDVQLESSTSYSKNKPGEVTVKFVNRGLTGVKFFNAKLLENSDYDIISPATVYIGEIDADDYETAEFNVYPKTDTAVLILALEYRDANNNPYSEQRQLPLTLYNDEEAGRFGLKETGNSGMIVALLVVVFGLTAFFFWRKTKK